jgi:ribose 5-phosphate isomerase B
MKPKVYFAADHWGFELIPTLVDYVNELGYETEHCGPFVFDEADDYPDFISVAAKKVAEDPEQSRAIIFGKSGQGEAMCANRQLGVRAVVYYGGPSEILSLSREHNNANVLSIGAGFIALEEIKVAIGIWLEASFPAEDRHVRRIKKIDALAL